MDAPPSLPPAPAYRDRSTGLVVFGVFAILLGAACALFVPLVFVGQMVAARRTGAEYDTATGIMAAGTYGVLAAVLITLGIGSIRARRWARALLLCLGWIGLAVGLVAMPILWITMSSIGETLRAQGQVVPEGSLRLIKVITVGFSAVIYVVIPLVTVLFYGGRNVKLTCEARDPVERWTDRCPLPVLVLCVGQAWGVVGVAFMLAAYGRAFPVFGGLAEGWVARLLWLGVMAFTLYTMRGFYRLERRVWWIYLVGSLLLGVSGLWTVQRVGIVGLYRHMGMPEPQLTAVAHSPLLQGNLIYWLSLGGVALWYGYLLYARRYFRPVTSRPAGA